MNFEESKIFRALYELPFHKVASRVLELSEGGRDVTQCDARRRTLLHHVALHGDKFGHSQSVAVVYQLALAGANLDAVDDDGDTALHKAVKHKSTQRILVALMR